VICRYRSPSWNPHHLRCVRNVSWVGLIPKAGVSSFATSGPRIRRHYISIVVLLTLASIRERDCFIISSMRSHGSAEELERRRRRAVALVQEGHGIREVALMVGSSSSAVVRWRDTYQARGEEGLRAKPRQGAKRWKLSPRQRGRLAKRLLKGPLSHGYRTELWTLRRVAEVIERHFGISYHPHHGWHVLRPMGWRRRKPERKAREADDEAVERWRREDWPRLKKRRTKRA
jgi:transposase